MNLEIAENQINSKKMWDMGFDRKSCKYLNKHATASRTAKLLKLLLTTQWAIQRIHSFQNQDSFNRFLYMDLKA